MNYEEAETGSDDKEKEATKRDIQTGAYSFDDIYCLKERRDLNDAVSLHLFDAVCPLKTTTITIEQLGIRLSRSSFL